MRAIPIACALAVLLAAPLRGEEPAEPRREAVHRAADEAARPPEPAWKKETRAALDRKVSFEFVDTPLSEALNFLQTLAKVNMILDPRIFAGKEFVEVPITLEVKDMTLSLALKWILRLAVLDYALKDGAVFITVPGNMGADGDVTIKIYDVRDLTAEVEDHPAPKVLPTGRIVPPKPEGNAVFMPETGGGFTTSHLAEMICTRVKPNLWAAELGTAIEERDGRLVVRQAPDVHARIGALLDAFRASRSSQVRTECRFVAVDEDLLARLRSDAAPGQSVVYLKAPQMKLLEDAIKEGDQAELVEAAEVSCFNAQRSHVMSGASFEERAADGDLDGTYFRGVILEVTPTISYDRLYVTMQLGITRIAKDAEDGPSSFFRIRTTLTCLSTDTVMIAGGTVPGDRATRLVVLVTPTVLRIEPGAGRGDVEAALRTRTGGGRDPVAPAVRTGDGARPRLRSRRAARGARAGAAGGDRPVERPVEKKAEVF